MGEGRGELPLTAAGDEEVAGVGLGVGLGRVVGVGVGLVLGLDDVEGLGLGLALGLLLDVLPGVLLAVPLGEGEVDDDPDGDGPAVALGSADPLGSVELLGPVGEPLGSVGSTPRSCSSPMTARICCS